MVNVDLLVFFVVVVVVGLVVDVLVLVLSDV